MYECFPCLYINTIYMYIRRCWVLWTWNYRWPWATPVDTGNWMWVFSTEHLQLLNLGKSASQLCSLVTPKRLLSNSLEIHLSLCPVLETSCLPFTEKGTTLSTVPKYLPARPTSLGSTAQGSSHKFILPSGKPHPHDPHGNVTTETLLLGWWSLSKVGVNWILVTCNKILVSLT